MLFVPAFPSLQWVVVLLLVAGAVAARKRAGWFAVLLFALGALLLDVTTMSAGDGVPLDWALAVAALFHLVVTVLLLVWYRSFRRGPGPGHCCG